MAWTNKRKKIKATCIAEDDIKPINGYESRDEAEKTHLNEFMSLLSTCSLIFLLWIHSFSIDCDMPCFFLFMLLSHWQCHDFDFFPTKSANRQNTVTAICSLIANSIFSAPFPAPSKLTDEYFQFIWSCHFFLQFQFSHCLLFFHFMSSPWSSSFFTQLKFFQKFLFSWKTLGMRTTHSGYRLFSKSST